MTNTNQLTIYLGSDHGGFELKQKLISTLSDKGINTVDCGADQLDPDDDYPIYAIKVAEQVADTSSNTSNKLGVLLCRSGAGMSIAANKVLGARAVQVASVEQVKHARIHNDANVITVAADTLSYDEIQAIVTAFISTKFSGEERHQRRINLINEYEKNRSQN